MMTIVSRKAATFNEEMAKDGSDENQGRSASICESLGPRANILPRYGDNRWASSPVLEVDSILTIARTAYETIAEGALLRPNFLPLKGATRGLYRRLRTSTDEGKGQSKKDSRHDPD